MRKLTAAKRARIPPGRFGIMVDGAGKYPVEDKNHARNALARASQQQAKGNLSPQQAAQIRAKANAVLKGKD
jgi:hypothetical protein